MSDSQFSTKQIARESALSTNKVLRNTYALLSLTLIFSAVMAMASTMLGVGRGAGFACAVAAIALLWFVLPRTARSTAGIFVVFAFTGLLGFSLGPILNHYLSMSNGGELIATSMGGTAVIFLGLSGYSLTTGRNFSFLGGFLYTGVMIILMAILAALLFEVSGLWLAINAAVIFVFSGFILFDTSRIVSGEEDNYLFATAHIFLSIFNIFSSLLHLLGFANE